MRNWAQFGGQSIIEVVSYQRVRCGRSRDAEKRGTNSTPLNKEKYFSCSAISNDDWDEYAIFHNVLYLFYWLLYDSKETAKWEYVVLFGSHWYALVLLRSIPRNHKQSLYRIKTLDIKNFPILVSKYFKLISKTPGYPAALPLNFIEKFEYFDSN